MMLSDEEVNDRITNARMTRHNFIVETLIDTIQDLQKQLKMVKKDMLALSMLNSLNPIKSEDWANNGPPEWQSERLRMEAEIERLERKNKEHERIYLDAHAQLTDALEQIAINVNLKKGKK